MLQISTLHFILFNTLLILILSFFSFLPENYLNIAHKSFVKEEKEIQFVGLSRS